jgi:hypothetical protein
MCVVGYRRRRIGQSVGLCWKTLENGYYSGIAAQQKTDETLTEIKRESNTLLVY